MIKILGFLQQPLSRFVSGFMACGFLLSIAGCSLGLFSGKQEDKSVLNTRSYRTIDPKCASLDLSSAEFTPESFLQVLDCVTSNQSPQGSNGALSQRALGPEQWEPVRKLFHNIPRADLEPLVQVLNRYLLSNRQRLYKIEQSHDQLSRMNLVEDFFELLSKFLGNRALTREIAGLTTRVFGSDEKEELLKAIGLFSSGIQADNVATALQLLLDVVTAPVFKDLQILFKDEIDAEILKGISKYLQEDHSYFCQDKPLDEPVLRSISSDFSDFLLTSAPSEVSSGPGVVQEILGKDELEIKKKVPLLASATRVLLTPGREISIFDSTYRTEVPLFKHLTRAFSELHQPIECMGQKIPSAVLHVMREISDPLLAKDPAKFIMRDQMLTLASLKPFCTYPPGLETHYNSLLQLAKVGIRPSGEGSFDSAFTPLAQVMKSIYQPVRAWKGCRGDQTLSEELYHPLAQMFVHLVGDVKSNGGGIDLLLPALDHLNREKVWNSLLLLTNTTSLEGQLALEKNLRFIFQKQEILRAANGREQSIFDVLTKIFSKEENFLSLYRISHILMSENDNSSYIEDTLFKLRTVFYINDVHPFVELFADLTAYNDDNKRLLEATIRVLDNPEFSAAADALSVLSKRENGGLKQVVESVLMLFHSAAEQGREGLEINELALQPFVPTRLHSLRASDLNTIEDQLGAFSPSWYDEDCRKLNLAFDLEHVPPVQSSSRSGFDEKLGAFLRCQNANSSVGDSIRTTVPFLIESTTDTAHGRQSFMGFSLNLMKRFISPATHGTEQAEAGRKFLFDAWFSSAKRGPGSSFYNILNALPILVDEPLQLNGSTLEPGPLLKPLLFVGGSLMVDNGTKRSVEILENVGARVVQSDETPKFLADLEDTLTERNIEEVTPTREQVLRRHDPVEDLFDHRFRARIKEWVRLRECATIPSTSENYDDRLNQRVQEIIDEVKHNVSSLDFVPENPRVSNSRRVPRANWDLDSVRTYLTPILNKAANPRTATNAGRTVIDSVVNFLRYFTLPEGEGWEERADAQRHYPPSKLVNWFYERSIDYRLITYYYPGENTPRVRLVNTLDLLELVLENVNFVPHLWLNVGRALPLKNMALDFLQEIAEAWGDLPRSKWPAEIQRKFPESGRPPMTLLQAVEDIINRGPMQENLSRLTYDFIGLPVLPSCYGTPSGEVADRQASPALRHTLPFSHEYLVEYQRRLYNVWQVNIVLRENAINSNIGHNGGLEVLRDLFFEVYYSSPRSVLDAHFPAAAGEANNLSIILNSVKLGGLSQFGRKIQTFLRPSEDVQDPRLSANWKTLNDSVAALIYSSQFPEMRQVLESLLQDDSEHRVILALLQQIFQVIDSNLQSPEKLAQLRGLGFYSLALLNHLEADTRRDLLKNMNAIVRGNEGFLAENADLLGRAVQSEYAASSVQLIYEKLNTEQFERLNRMARLILGEVSGLNSGSEVPPSWHLMNLVKKVHSTPAAKQNFELFSERLRALGGSSGFQALRLEESLLPIMRFLQKRPPPGQTEVNPAMVTASNQFRASLALSLAQNDFSQFLLLANPFDGVHAHDQVRSNPSSLEKFYQVLQTLSQSIGRGDESLVKDFLQNIVVPTLSEKPDTRYSNPYVNTRRAVSH